MATKKESTREGRATDTAASVAPDKTPDSPPTIRLRVTARTERRCRAGLCFSGEPAEIDVAPGHAALLEADPLLTVERL